MKKRLFALTLAALLLLCGACTPAAEVTPSPTPALEVTPTPTPEPTPTPTVEPSPAPTGLEGELYAAVEDFFDLKRDAVNGVEIPAELANTDQSNDALARAEAMRAYWEEWGTHIVSIETELRDFQMRWVKDGSAMVSVYEWTWVDYNGTGKDDPATDRMGWGYPHDVTLEQWSNGTYHVKTDRSGEFEDTNYKSKLCMVSENHKWFGSGYSYTSEALGVRVEFPPEWEQYFTFEEEEVEGLLRSGKSGRVIRLASEFVFEDDPEYDTAFARIYWVPKGDEGFVWNDETLVTLWESDEGAYICEVNTMLQLNFDPNPGVGGPRPEYAEIRTVYETVQNGIFAGEWGFETWK